MTPRRRWAVGGLLGVVVAAGLPALASAQGDDDDGKPPPIEAESDIDAKPADEDGDKDKDTKAKKATKDKKPRSIEVTGRVFAREELAIDDYSAKPDEWTSGRA